jgi:hypothetical protein
MTIRTVRAIALLAAAVATLSCGSSAPAAATLHDSFAQQLGANKFVKDFQRTGDDLTFSGPGAEGSLAKWRVHIDSATIQPENATEPMKGLVKSSWYADNKLVSPRGRESNLPIELMDNGLAQECWANWDKNAKRWSWE